VLLSAFFVKVNRKNAVFAKTISDTPAGLRMQAKNVRF
jgi:hypothetical protein